MSEVIIKSDFGSFKESEFYISQAQRFLCIIGVSEFGSEEEWLTEYLEDLYFDSFNREFKSFYLETADEYNVVSDGERKNILISLLNIAIDKASSETESEFESFLLKRIEFDEENADIFNPEDFVKDVKGDEYGKQAPKRVLFVLQNIVKLLRKENPLSLKEYESNRVS